MRNFSRLSTHTLIFFLYSLLSAAILVNFSWISVVIFTFSRPAIRACHVNGALVCCKYWRYVGARKHMYARARARARFCGCTLLRTAYLLLRDLLGLLAILTLP